MSVERVFKDPAVLQDARKDAVSPGSTERRRASCRTRGRIGASARFSSSR